MARTSSQKLEFWQFEVGLFNDMKMVDLNEKYGTLGEAVYFRILSYIADSEGYYAVLSDSLILSIYRSIGSKWLRDKRVILRIIHYCGECGLFDVNLLSQNVISSSGIQRRWLYAKEKARAKGFTTDKFWLLDGQGFDKCTQNQDKCSNNADKCDNNSSNCDNNMPCTSKVKESEVNTNVPRAREEFFKIYPALRGSTNVDDSGIDYKKLLDRFNKSKKFLQTRNSLRWVIEHYEEIISGKYDDFKDCKVGQEEPAYIAALNAKSDRERWYAQRREKALGKAEAIKSKLMKRKDFFEVNGKLGELMISIARAEVGGDEGLEMKLREEQEYYQGIKEDILSRQGYKESDLLPKWHCRKCEDTGFLPNGKMCDCYEKEKR